MALLDTGAMAVVDVRGLRSSDSGLRVDRVDGVDLLRGLSILLVLMNHVNMQLLFAHVPYTRGLPEQLVATLVWSGQYGVQIFFAVSGFLITSTSLRRWKSPELIAIRGFYWLRLARIGPLLVLLLAVLSGLDLAGVEGFVVSSKTGGLGRALAAALTFHVNYLEATRGYLPGNWDILWSLSVEEMFYLFFPLLARVLGRRKMLASGLVPLLLLLVVAGPFARSRMFNPNPVWREYSYLGGMDAIALGCLTAMVLSGRVSLGKTLARGWVWACVGCGAGLLVFGLGFSSVAETMGLERVGLDMTVVAVGACLVIAAASQSRWRAPWMLWPVTGIGRRSYEVYLTHEFVVLGLFALFVRVGKPLGLVVGLFLSVILVAGLLGWAVAVGFAEPVNWWMRKAGTRD